MPGGKVATSASVDASTTDMPVAVARYSSSWAGWLATGDVSSFNEPHADATAMTARMAQRRRMPPLQRQPAGGSLADPGRDPQCCGFVDLGLEADHDAVLFPDERVARKAQGVLDGALTARRRVEDL